MRMWSWITKGAQEHISASLTQDHMSSPTNYFLAPFFLDCNIISEKCKQFFLKVLRCEFMEIFGVILRSKVVQVNSHSSLHSTYPFVTFFLLSFEFGEDIICVNCPCLQCLKMLPKNAGAI